MCSLVTPRLWLPLPPSLTLQSRAIFAVPSPLEYFSWVFCFTSFFAGPAFELREYQNSVNRSSAEVAKLPSRVGTVLGRFLFGVRLCTVCTPPASILRVAVL